MTNAKISLLFRVCFVASAIVIGEEYVQGSDVGLGKDGKQLLPSSDIADQVLPSPNMTDQVLISSEAATGDEAMTPLAERMMHSFPSPAFQPTPLAQGDKLTDDVKEGDMQRIITIIQRNYATQTISNVQTLNIPDVVKKSESAILMSAEILPTPSVGYKQSEDKAVGKADDVVTSVGNGIELSRTVLQSTVNFPSHTAGREKDTKSSADITFGPGISKIVTESQPELSASETVATPQESQLVQKSLIKESVLARELLSASLFQNGKSVGSKDLAETYPASSHPQSGNKPDIGTGESISAWIPQESAKILKSKETQKVIEINPTPTISFGNSLASAEKIEASHLAVETDDMQYAKTLSRINMAMLSGSVQPVKGDKGVAVSGGVQPSQKINLQSSVPSVEISLLQSKFISMSSLHDVQVKPLPTPSIVYNPKEGKFLPSSAVDISLTPETMESYVSPTDVGRSPTEVNLKTNVGEKAGKAVTASRVSMTREVTLPVAMETVATESVPVSGTTEKGNWGAKDSEDVTHHMQKSGEISIIPTLEIQQSSQELLHTYSAPGYISTKQIKQVDILKTVSPSSSVVFSMRQTPLVSQVQKEKFESDDEHIVKPIGKFTIVQPSPSVLYSRSLPTKPPVKSKQVTRSAVPLPTPEETVIASAKSVKKSIPVDKESMQTMPSPSQTIGITSLVDRTVPTQPVEASPTPTKSDKSSVRSPKPSKIPTETKPHTGVATGTTGGAIPSLPLGTTDASPEKTTPKAKPKTFPPKDLHTNPKTTASKDKDTKPKTTAMTKPAPEVISPTEDNQPDHGNRPPATNPTMPSYPEIYIELILAMTWNEFCPIRKDFTANLALIARNVSVIKALTFNVVLLNDYRYCGNTESNLKFLERRASEIYLDLYYAIKNKYNKKLTVQAGYAIEKDHRYLGNYASKLLRVSISGESTPTQPTYGDHPPHFLGWTLGVVIVSVVLIACFISGTYKMRRRKLMMKKEMEAIYGSGGENLVMINHHQDKDSVQLTPLSVQNGNSKLFKKCSKSIVAAVNYAMDWDETLPQVFPSHVLTVDSLSKFYTYTEAIDEEFQSLPNPVVKQSDIPSGVDRKNRYSNALPPPKSRVQLTYHIEDDTSEYINANFIKGYNDQKKEYIATQAPMENTAVDFWRMIWEQQSRVILMLTDMKGKRCHQYWPTKQKGDEATQIHGDYLISVQSVDEKEYCTITTLLMKDIEKNLCRTLTHHWFTCWPHDHEPDEPSSIVSFLLDARLYIHEHHGPVVVHCSPGTGRTGTVIAIDIGMRALEDRTFVDVPYTVCCIRQDRAGAVQTKEQYNIIYQALYYYSTRLQQQFPAGEELDEIIEQGLCAKSQTDF